MKDTSNYVRWKKKHSEFEIHAWLWMSLLNMGYMARGEVSASLCSPVRAKFDIVIFKPSESGIRAERIIEVKRQKKENARIARANAAQIERYINSFGLPVDVVYGPIEARAYLANIRNLCTPYPQSSKLLERCGILVCPSEGMSVRQRNGDKYALVPPC